MTRHFRIPFTSHHRLPLNTHDLQKHNTYPELSCASHYLYLTLKCIINPWVYIVVQKWYMYINTNDCTIPALFASMVNIILYQKRICKWLWTPCTVSKIKLVSQEQTGLICHILSYYWPLSTQTKMCKQPHTPFILHSQSESSLLANGGLNHEEWCLK